MYLVMLNETNITFSQNEIDNDLSIKSPNKYYYTGIIILVCIIGNQSLIFKHFYVNRVNILLLLRLLIICQFFL